MADYQKKQGVQQTLEGGIGTSSTDKPFLPNSPEIQRNSSFRGIYSSSLIAAGNTLKGKVRQLRSIFEAAKLSTTRSPHSPPPSAKSSKNSSDSPADSPFRLPGTEDRVVIYFTSLRGIRKTFQDCHSIRTIFRGFRVNLDERDASMDVGYRKELQKVLGESNVPLPQVFIKGKYIGGADVIRQLHENDELEKLIKGLALMALKPCEGCDDIRFVLCTACGGSRKLYDEEEEMPRRCGECNENGLVRCPFCRFDG